MTVAVALNLWLKVSCDICFIYLNRYKYTRSKPGSEFIPRELLVNVASARNATVAVVILILTIQSSYYFDPLWKLVSVEKQLNKNWRLWFKIRDKEMFIQQMTCAWESFFQLFFNTIITNLHRHPCLSFFIWLLYPAWEFGLDRAYVILICAEFLLFDVMTVDAAESNTGKKLDNGQ